MQCDDCLSSVTWPLFVRKKTDAGTHNIFHPKSFKVPYFDSLKHPNYSTGFMEMSLCFMLLHHSASLLAQAKDYVLLFRHQRWKETSEGQWHIPVSSHTVVFKGIMPYAAYENNTVFIGPTIAQLLPKLTDGGFWKCVFKNLSLLPYSESP